MRKQDDWELLAPAGSPETFRAVVQAGADAVYVGGAMFGARAYADNFTTEELCEAIDFAHLRGKKVYLTVNTLMKNAEIYSKLYEYLLPFYERGLDAVLVQDFGVLVFIHQAFPDLPIHTSTQMTVTNVEGVRFLQRYGVTRVVMAREVSLEEMKQIHEETGMELEAFVHGALCYCYSGQCLFSSMLGGRSGNRGRCAQPCRLPYSVQTQKKGENFPDSYILSMKDLCGIEHLPELFEAGVYSLKIEGRMKQAVYAAGVVSLYRKYMDLFLNNPDKYEVSREDQQKLAELGSRCGFTDQYYHANNGKDMITFQKPNYEKKNDDLQQEILETYIEQKNSIAIVGEAVFHKGEAALLRVKPSSGGQNKDEERWLEVSGGVVDAARNAPLSPEDLKARLQKTGDSPFVFEQLNVDAQPDIFVPNGAVNQLRRTALGQLKEQMLAGFCRDAGACHVPEVGEIVKSTFEGGSRDGILECTDRQHHYIAAVSTGEQLGAVIDDSFIDTVYLESTMFLRKAFIEQLRDSIERLKKEGKQIYLCLPVIFRRDTKLFYQRMANSLEKLEFRGFVARNYEELEWVQTNFPDKELVADHNLYTYNDYAKAAFHGAGVDRDTVPLELNRKEIARRDNTGSEIIVYGYYPLMVSAQCVHRNSMKCDQCETVTYLKDRYQKRFPVRNYCSECYNMIYNSLPTQLLGELREFDDSLNWFRLNFTVEDAGETKHILHELQAAATAQTQTAKQHPNSPKYTSGHYKRGVE